MAGPRHTPPRPPPRARRASSPPRLHPQRTHHLLDVVPYQALVPRIAQEVGRMEGRHQLDAVEIEPLAAQPGDRGLGAQQRLGRELPERDHDFGSNQLDLPAQEGLARVDLVGLGVAVPRRPALDDVADVDVLPAKPHALRDDLGQQLSGAADEGLAAQVLVVPRALSHEDQASTGIAYTEDEVRPPRSELAPAAVAEDVTQALE